MNKVVWTGLENNTEKKEILFQKNFANMLFVHWKHDIQDVQRLLPHGFKPDTYHGQAYITMACTQVSNCKYHKLIPDINLLNNNMGEYYLYTYCLDPEGKPSVYIISAESNNWFAIQLAKSLYNFSYTYSDIFYKSSIKEHKDELMYISDIHKLDHKVHPDFKYIPQSVFKPCEENSFEDFSLNRNIAYYQTGNKNIVYKINYSPEENILCSTSELQTHNINIYKINNINLPEETVPAHSNIISKLNIQVNQVQKIRV